MFSMQNTPQSPDYTRILDTFRFREPDRVPAMELLIDLPIQEQILGRPIRRLEDEIEFYCKAGYDYFYQKASYEFPKIPPVLAFGTNIRREAQEDGSDVSFDPHGECPLKDRPGFAQYRWPDPDKIDYSNLDRAAELIPQGMGIVAGVGGIFARAWILMGFDTFCLQLSDDPDYVAEVFEAIGSIQVEVARRLVRQPKVFALWYSDDFAYVTGPMVPPAALRRLLFPHMRKMIEITHDAGLPFIYHGCGNLLPVLDDLVEMGIDALHPIEPKAMNIYEIKPRLYGRVAIIGNVDVGEVLTRGTPGMIEADVQEHIRLLAPGGGYVISSSNSISYYVPADNYRAFLNAIRKHGQYPIGKG